MTIEKKFFASDSFSKITIQYRTYDLEQVILPRLELGRSTR